MKEYLSYREQSLLNFIKRYYFATLKVKFDLPRILEKLTPFNDYEEVVNTAMALEIRNYVTIINEQDNLNHYDLKIVLTEKTLNSFFCNN